eukprot:3294013-Prymnesium_polylepis.2
MSKEPLNRQRSSSVVLSKDVAQSISIANQIVKSKDELLRRLCDVASVLQYETTDEAVSLVVSDLADIFQKYQLRSVAEASERRAANTVVVANHQLLLRAIRPLLSTDDSAHSSATTDDLDECVDRVRELASNARASDALARVRSSVADSIRTDEDQVPR